MSAKPIVVIPGDDPPQVQGSAHLDRLKEVAEMVLYTDRPTTPEEQVRRAKNAVCLINSRASTRWYGDSLRQLPSLKMITVCGIGTDTIDLATAREMGIAVCNLPGRTAPIVGEHAVALMLAVARRLAYYTQQLKAGRWFTMDNTYLHGKMLGLIGAGPTALATASLAKALGMKLQAWTFNPSPARSQELGIPFVSLEDLLTQSDVVSLHVKLTDQSRGLIGARELNLMKPGAVLINTARGAVVDTAALVAALQSGKLGGAGIDVYDTEPIAPDHPLLSCEQVVLTPHNADQTPEGMDMLNSGVVDNVIAFLNGNPVNRVG